MGANNSVTALIKVAESVATLNLIPKSSNDTPPPTAGVLNSDWCYYVRHKGRSIPKPKNFDSDLDAQFIIDPAGVDVEFLKTKTKSEVAGCIFAMQNDVDFCKFLDDMSKISSACKPCAEPVKITPVKLTNMINSIIEIYFSPELIYRYAAMTCEFPSIGTRAITFEHTDYPSGLVNYASQSVQHSYVANIAGILLNILEEHSSTAFIASEIRENANHVERKDTLVILILFIIAIAIIVIGGYSIFHVVVNETHHAN